MKADIIVTAALAFALIAAPCAQALASGNENHVTLTPSKKTAKKSKKKTTKKKTKKTTTTTPKKTTVTNNAAQTEGANAATVVKKEATQGANNSTLQQNNTSAGSGSILGGILSALGGGDNTESSGSSSAAGDIISGLTSIFNSSKVASKNQLVGTWTYTEPAVVFSSNNVLKNIGGKVASQAIENQLQTQFNKLGIKKGAMTMTFDKDGNFTQSVGSKTMTGTYTVSGKSVTLKYAGGVQQFVGTTQIDGSDLLIVMDASKLLKYANTIGSLTGNSTLKAAGSLLSSMDGMEVGLKLNK